jgi:outer membrane protein assembly factor BamE (lipoprotein component of BamABCDE complex)
MPQFLSALRRPAVMILSGAAALALVGCAETIQHGYIPSDIALQQVPVGSSRDQVLIALGTPSTIGEYTGEVFYYISQTRQRAALFMDARIVDQRILAIYFDSNDRVSQIAEYGLQDGQVFDFVTMTTPTGGQDLNFIQGLLRGVFGGR